MDDYTPFAELYDLFYADFEEDSAMYLGFAGRIAGPILEVGSGTGRVALALAAEGRPIVGLELSEALRAVAQHKADRAQLTDRVTFIAGDMRRFKLDQHFGLIERDLMGGIEDGAPEVMWPYSAGMALEITLISSMPTETELMVVPPSIEVTSIPSS